MLVVKRLIHKIKILSPTSQIIENKNPLSQSNFNDI